MKINIVEIILLSFAVWRVTSLIAQEKGPFGIFERLREKVGISHYASGEVCEIPDKFFCELFSCVWCLSVWVSAGFVIAYIFLPVPTIYFALWLSLSTITIMVNDGVLR